MTIWYLRAPKIKRFQSWALSIPPSLWKGNFVRPFFSFSFFLKTKRTPSRNHTRNESGLDFWDTLSCFPKRRMPAGHSLKRVPFIEYVMRGNQPDLRWHQGPEFRRQVRIKPGLQEFPRGGKEKQTPFSRLSCQSEFLAVAQQSRPRWWFNYADESQLSAEFRKREKEESTTDKNKNVEYAFQWDERGKGDFGGE